MNSHLSEDQLSMWILGRSTVEEMRHGRECPQCRAELARFEAPVSTFRSVMLESLERESSPRIEGVSTLLRRPQADRNTSWRWVAVSMAAIMLAAIPTYKQGPALVQRTGTDSEELPLPSINVAAEPNADALLMDSVSAHLSQTIPAPMEPILALIPTQKELVQPGGSQ